MSDLVLDAVSDADGVPESDTPKKKSGSWLFRFCVAWLIFIVFLTLFWQWLRS